MWLPTNIIAEVEKLARIYYIDVVMTQRWNAHRHADELRLLTGWCWVSRGGNEYRQGFKTMTVAYRDAYYELVNRSAAPIPGRSKAQLKVVERKVANG